MRIKMFYLTAFFAITILLGFFIPNAAIAFEIPNVDQYIYPDGHEKTISMDFRDASLNDILKIFSQQSGLNFIASSGISNMKINLYLDKVPVEEALEKILSANSLTYEISPGSNIFLVKKQEKPEQQLTTRIYPLKFASVSSAKINDFSGGGSSSGSSQGSEGSSEKKSGGSNSGSGIISAIKSLMTKSGSLTEDPRTNSIIVTDIPDVFPSIEQTLARLDIRTPQILIEVEMLDVTKDSTELIGLKWGDTPLTFTGAQKSSYAPFESKKAIADGADPISYVAGGSGGSNATTAAINFSGLTYMLQFLRTQTDTKNLARPRILTLNNQTAEIEIATDQAIGTTQTTSGAGNVGQSNVSAERAKTGVFLRVTPQANVQTKEITLAVEPKVIQASKGGTFNNTTFFDTEERGSKSLLRIKDGDTVIIAGLLRNDSSNVNTKVPLLSQIPIVGWAFKHKDTEEKQRELIVFITPHIVQEDLERNESVRPRIVREQSPLTKLSAVNREMTRFDDNSRF
ncbi:MAG: hypothetical protein HQL24_02200 [Candidatus Omnitrophica bacterium]|nr:hypothetical protein [Candidatus Omnitrophota bacterium]